MNDVVFVISILIGFTIAFSLLWFVIVYSISRLSGWAKLASRYPVLGRVEGKVFYWRSARFRFLVSYSNCLTVTVSPEGVHLQPMIFFRIGHDPIMIPRHAIVEMTPVRNFLLPSMNMKVKNPTKQQTTTIILYGRKLVESLEEAFAN